MKRIFTIALFFISFGCFASISDTTKMYKGVSINPRTKTESPIGEFKITKGEGFLEINGVKYLVKQKDGSLVCHVENSSLLMPYKEEEGIISIQHPYNTWKFRE